VSHISLVGPVAAPASPLLLAPLREDVQETLSAARAALTRWGETHGVDMHAVAHGIGLGEGALLAAIDGAPTLREMATLGSPRYHGGAPADFWGDVTRTATAAATAYRADPALATGYGLFNVATAMALRCVGARANAVISENSSLGAQRAAAARPRAVVLPPPNSALSVASTDELALPPVGRRLAQAATLTESAAAPRMTHTPLHHDALWAAATARLDKFAPQPFGGSFFETSALRCQVRDEGVGGPPGSKPHGVASEGAAAAPRLPERLSRAREAFQPVAPEARGDFLTVRQAVVDGLRVGRYGPDEMVPGPDDLANLLGVQVVLVDQTLLRLAKQGVLTPRLSGGMAMSKTASDVLANNVQLQPERAKTWARPVRDRLHDEIAAGRLETLTTRTQQQLATQWAVSRDTFDVALQTLEAEGTLGRNAEGTLVVVRRPQALPEPQPVEQPEAATPPLASLRPGATHRTVRAALVAAIKVGQLPIDRPLDLARLATQLGIGERLLYGAVKRMVAKGELAVSHGAGRAMGFYVNP
jgi:DNA-binding transcriptional regulator YhcF (GntR family)